MKNLIQTGLVIMLQFIACYLAEWDMPETGFILAFVLLWQGLFIWLFHQISKKHNIPGEYKFSKVIWYIIMPVCSLISPLLSLAVFMFGTLCDLRKVSGCSSIKGWLKAQIVYGECQRGISVNEFNCDRVNMGVVMPMIDNHSVECTYITSFDDTRCYSNEPLSYINNDQSSYENTHIDINPTTGLPMIDGIGSVDVSGNIYGSGRYD